MNFTGGSDPEGARAYTPATYQDYLAMPRPAPDAEIAYGDAPSQRIDLFLPARPGPHPVVVFLHGGCWSVTRPGREAVRAGGADLARRGMVAWSVGCRRADEEGGGYPGTFLDVAAAIDRLRDEAGRHDLDLGRVVLAGHSSGGHLALWAAARRRLSPGSPLHSADPFLPRAVVSIAGITDLATPQSTCPADVVERLAGQATPERPDVHAETSPVRLLPAACPVWLASGELDPIVRAGAALAYAEAAKRVGQQVTMTAIPGAGHFDLVRPGSPAWEIVVGEIESALQ